LAVSGVPLGRPVELEVSTSWAALTLRVLRAGYLVVAAGDQRSCDLKVRPASEVRSARRPKASVETALGLLPADTAGTLCTTHQTAPDPARWLLEACRSTRFPIRGPRGRFRRKSSDVSPRGGWTGRGRGANGKRGIPERRGGPRAE